jgi:ribonuclease HII|tara:strand:+ start:19 stop:636 length:618 start_codon:yes stop_codon:yes gene_type:complete
MKICGIDDAGRGSMIGPLVIAGVSIEKRNLKKLKAIGVRDSKKLTPKKREILYKKIIKIVDSYYVVRITPQVIDRSVINHNLNHLEARNMAKIVLKLKSQISYVDSCDVDYKRFGKEISSLSSNARIKSYHHADSRFVSVAAASIIAKVSRDRSLKRLNKNFELGSGYPSDKKTVHAVKKILSKKKTMPFIRMSWKPIQKIIQKN